MAHSLVEAGRFSWDEFREQLIIALDRGAVGSDQYYERFLLALERTLAAKKFCAETEVAQRAEEYSARPHGHDH